MLQYIQVVFLNIFLVGYVENISTDPGVMAHSSIWLNILYFLGYEVDEERLTISCSRKLFTGDVFEEVYTRVFKLFIEAGLVSGHTTGVTFVPDPKWSISFNF